MLFVGAVKMKLKWADGKVLKEIIDQQVSKLVHKCILHTSISSDCILCRFQLHWVRKQLRMST